MLRNSALKIRFVEKTPSALSFFEQSLTKSAFIKISFIIFLVLGSFSLWAEEAPHRLQFNHRQGQPLPEYLRVKPKDLELAPDKFYTEYFLKEDQKIVDLASGIYNAKDPRLSLEALRYTEEAKLRKEEVARHDFARQILRMRMNYVFDTELRKLSTGGLSKIHQGLTQVLNRLQNVSIPLEKTAPPKEPPKKSAPPTPIVQTAQRENANISDANTTPQPSEIRLGYDLLTDNSKLEYLMQGFEFGIYHPSLLSALLGANEKWSLASMSLSNKLGRDLPSLRISTPLNLAYYESSVSQTFGENLNTALIATQPLKNTQGERRIEVRLSYPF